MQGVLSSVMVKQETSSHSALAVRKQGDVDTSAQMAQTMRYCHPHSGRNYPHLVFFGSILWANPKVCFIGNSKFSQADNEDSPSQQASSDFTNTFRRLSVPEHGSLPLLDVFSHGMNLFTFSLFSIRN